MTAEEKAKIKDSSREDRMSFRNFEEHKMRREFKDRAIDKCKDRLDVFGKCAQENGLMVTIRCRQKFSELNACMEEHNSHKAFEKYLDANKEEFEKRIIKTPSS